MLPIYVNASDYMSSAFPYYMTISVVDDVLLHRHDCIELALVSKGNGEHYVNNKKYHLEPGSVFFILPYQTHRLNAAAGTTLELYVCYVGMAQCFYNDDTSRTIYDILFKADDTTSHILTHPDSDMRNATTLCDMRSIVLSMYTLYNDLTNPYREILFKHAINILIMNFDLIRTVQNPPQITTSVIVNKRVLQNQNNTSVLKIIQYIYQNYDQTITLNSLSEEFHLTPQHVSTLINKHFGQNLRSFINVLRIHHATALITTTDIPISQIAMDVGYESIGSFFRIFHNIMNKKPTDLRKESENANSENDKTVNSK